MKVTAMLPDAEPALGETLRRSLRDAKAAIEEGREKVAALRASAGQASALEDCLRVAAEQDAAPGQALHRPQRGEGTDAAPDRRAGVVRHRA